MPISEDEDVGDLLEAGILLKGAGSSNLSKARRSWLWNTAPGGPQRSPKGRVSSRTPSWPRRGVLLLGEHPEVEENQRKLVKPIKAGGKSSEGFLEALMHPLHHPIRLGVVGRGHDVVDAEARAEGGPNCRRKMRTSVSGEGSNDNKSAGPVL